MGKSNITEKEIEKMLKDINSDDLKEMFGTIFATTILKKDLTQVVEKLTNYYTEYTLPVSIGDVFMMDNKTYTVTCAYTDNSVDVSTVLGTKTNVGLFNKDIKIIGKLQCVEEE